MPCILDIALKGRRALNVLIVLKASILVAPIKVAVRLIRETITIRKSSQHQALVKYLAKPRATNLIHISMKKITVNIRSI